MYRLVSVGALPHTAPMYRKLSAQLAQARREEERKNSAAPWPTSSTAGARRAETSA